MSILGWVILVHVVEVLLIGGYLLVRKNNKLEQVISDQQQYIDALSVVIQNSNEIVQRLDSQGAFEADDEVGTFFKNLKEIQDILNQFNSRQN
jgi:hypothetical protein|tara:strand:+ start:466 stop:744 length:279 start_codon:yes stop_codon:yes gene_type:complete